MGGFATRNKGCRFTTNASAERGFTLIEVMVTLVVLALGMLASIIGIMAALDCSLLNEMRNDAMKLAQEQEEAARNMPYTSIAGIAATQTITRQVRKTRVTYQVNFQKASAPGTAGMGMSLVTFTVTWNYKNPGTTRAHQYQYVLQTIVRQAR
ncbi:MAG: prepilin-type N-terminal cleavage/methylation domain-containing protein [Syntrophobacteraceae bacterium]|jgi:prepilin-type N-terminal cleavage/methylation domain-containing protein